jgi:predicted cupin superfamily sugar epimerase
VLTSAVSTGAFALVGCKTVPEFQFSGFEPADKNWAPGGD